MVSSRLKVSKSDGQAPLVGCLLRMAEGDRTALRALFDSTSAKLMGVCLRILKDRDEAEDVLQEVYISVWRRAGSFDPDKASPIAWLATIARNRSIDRLRARRPRGESAPLEQADDVADEVTPDGFAAAAARDEGERLQHCLETLDARAQQMIRTAFFEGLSYPELAAQAGAPLGSIKSWVRRGLLRLRECLSQ
jgi:RNA polymerase sigma-70 factor (ECF subfamily)